MKLSDGPLRVTDQGFFGPDSPTWKVWAAPTALIGFQRSVVLEHFDPDLTAAVADSAGIYTDPFGRLDRTLAYFLLVATADGRTAIAASEHLMDVHRKATGIEPVTGKRYSANNPTSQLWIHVTGWHSVLKCYEMYGPGPLAPDQEARYWRDCVTAAELQTCDPADVPASRDEVRAYFARVRPRLALTERARTGMHYLLRTRDRGVRLRTGSSLIAPATIATLPRWMRTMGGFDQPGIVDSLYPRAVRLAVRAASAQHSAGTVRLSGLIAPMTGDILRRHFAQSAEPASGTVTPAQAREQYGRAARTAPAS
ncbi:oxygenase MpaB family protein [Tsukamurella sp. 1534]|uniref:oxygenase MpaB family protein n=1 Tax=Tsukamurella sp. 1534 TaxID=1151061 RepID=UPI0002F00A68|nr:oxygenase MpaB family protein [Tsukamurella sp. 1534]